MSFRERVLAWLRRRRYRKYLERVRDFTCDVRNRAFAICLYRRLGVEFDVEVVEPGPYEPATRFVARVRGSRTVSLGTLPGELEAWEVRGNFDTFVKRTMAEGCSELGIPPFGSLTELWMKLDLMGEPR